MSVIPISLITAASFAQARGVGVLNHVALPIAVLIAVNLVLRGFISFATHYLMHKVPAFWRVHRVHHLDTELDVSSTVRFHPFEFVVALIPGIPMVLAFGLTPWILMVYELMDVVVTLWSHSNLRLPVALDRALQYLVVTPDLHRVHHSSWQPETDSNFGAVLPIWDLVFGTFRTIPRDRHPTMELGLSEMRAPVANRLGWLLKSIGLSELERQAVILERAAAPTRSPGAGSSR
jgi:sterol desaturase/sphingolipid hydroxylase (fatty acid hydroxylase superfamily)